jgi:hypothetical protein
MPYQNISASLSEADIQAVKDAFSTVLQKLPFLVNLTPDERKAIFKAGPDRVSFVQNAAAAAKNNPHIFPASFDAQEFQRDVELFADLSELSTLADSVASQIDDTRLEDLEPVFRQIAAELRAQYLLQYLSNNEAPAGKFLNIRVTTPARPGLNVRARQGYYKKG